MNIEIKKIKEDTNEQLNSHEKLCQSRSLIVGSVAEAIVKVLEDIGVEYAFGVSGGAIAPMWAALNRSSVQVLHFRHEAGAAFAAIEAHFASDRPIVVFTTTGPGITNALTGVLAARWEGAKVILISAATATSQRGRWACQETSTYTMPSAGIFTSGEIFHYAATLEYGEQLPEIADRLALGIAQPGGFVAHISIPTNIQTSPFTSLLPQVNVVFPPAFTISADTIQECARLLSEDSFAIWVGFGARNAVAEIHQLAETTGAAVMCSPRGKGIFPEDHPQFVGVTGFGGHDSVLRYMHNQRPKRILVLGTRLGEFTSFWNPNMIPSEGFVHIDIDPQVPRSAYPSADTIAIQADIREFLKALLNYLPAKSVKLNNIGLSQPRNHLIQPRDFGLVRPQLLMKMIQEAIIDGSKALVMAECGNSFAWAIHFLKFNTPNRYRISNGFGAMGHFVTGVVGAALARHKKAVAIVGDGAMLMNNEISTAVKHQILAVWIVLNDGRYNICEQGMTYLGFKDVDATIPPADFVKIAQGMGADGIRVEKETEIKAALEQALSASGPFVVDVIIDPTEIPPTQTRNQSLILQGATNY
ncbi:thiamine pyrophosphate-dependent enzyme [Nostoc sp. FACHB-110]|uniref:thiamine pyrophosphate-dependent enzyme n=1 Tax=Nostoc sp. FACHB-110 TaxID=2692834 RepID=UPI0016849F07|nr:thiamine pyrophosphate-dependent enzyme [Nostoc sp. FACHB-110]MBD2441566.1 thiamine pyrophosphate-binding protein [Nostoc sp. FACHB-110]